MCKYSNSLPSKQLEGGGCLKFNCLPLSPFLKFLSVLKCGKFEDSATGPPTSVAQNRLELLCFSSTTVIPFINIRIPELSTCTGKVKETKDSIFEILN